MKTFESIIQIAGTLGLGAFIGILVKNALDRNREQNARLFEARREAYKNVIGRIKNFFSEDDTRNLPPKADPPSFDTNVRVADNRLERRMRMNSFFSDALLLGSRDLRSAIEEYMDRVDDIDAKIDAAATDQEADELDDELGRLIERIESLMRKELGVR